MSDSRPRQNHKKSPSDTIQRMFTVISAVSVILSPIITLCTIPDLLNPVSIVLAGRYEELRLNHHLAGGRRDSSSVSYYSIVGICDEHLLNAVGMSDIMKT